MPNVFNLLYLFLMKAYLYSSYIHNTYLKSLKWKAWRPKPEVELKDQIRYNYFDHKFNKL